MVNERRRIPVEKQGPLYQEIIVKFHEGGSLEEKDGQFVADHLSLKRFNRFVKSTKGIKVYRSFATDAKRLQKMQTQANRGLSRPVPNLSLFVRVRLDEEAEIEPLLKQLSQDPDIEYACIAGIPGPPPVTPDFTGLQDYEDMAADGVDAQYAWFFPGGNGAGVQVCDCEYGFNPSHEDLPPVTVVYSSTGDLTSWAFHGTAVLGELASISDVKGVTGIGHGATLMFASETGGNRLNCINAAIAALVPGDVLVLEMQTGSPYKPAEYDTDVHAAVATAVGTGIVVVAAAGNGYANLTTSTDAAGHHIWDPASPEYDDSGAIIVGAGTSNSDANPHSKCSFSDYGERVNCQGWGEDVVTTGTGDLYNGGANADYTDSFGGTSSATPIVAGVVTCLQGIAIQALGAPLAPAVIRSIISDPANGTPQADSPLYPAATNHIGPLPDLRRVIRAAGIFPDVYMRDNVADTGTEPYAGSVLCWSPDIIVRKDPVANPLTDFGVATWGNANLGENIEFGEDNAVYVRMYNRGNAPDDVDVSVYWTDASGFILPPSWHLIGILNVTNVLPGEYRVAGPITWPQAQVPSPGHYCLIGVVNSTRDPIVIPGAFADAIVYMDFIRNHNNICYRNCTVEDVVPSAPIPPYSFMLKGLPERSAAFRLEIHSQLPMGSEVQVEMAKQMDLVLKEVDKLKKPIKIQRQPVKTIYRIINGQPLIVDNIALKRNAVIPVNMQVKLPKNPPNGEYLVFADQYLEGKHLGRVNYVIRVGIG